MTEMSNSAAPSGYRLRVRGHLPDHWEAWFDGFTVSRGGDGTTSLCGPVPDQAALHGLLSKIRDLGVLLISVEAIFPTAKQRPPTGAPRAYDPAPAVSGAPTAASAYDADTRR